MKNLIYSFKRKIKRRNFLTRILSIGLYFLNLPRKVRNPERIKKILVVHNNYLGDTVFFSPVYRNLKSHFPNARITSLCGAAYAELISADKNIDEIIIHPKYSAENNVSFMTRFRFIFALRKQGFDIIVDLYSDYFTVALAFLYLFRAYRIEIYWRALKDTFRSYIYILNGHTAREYKREHAVIWNLRLLERLGIQIKDNEVTLPVRDEWTASLFKKHPELKEVNGRYFVICPGASWSERQWSVEKFARVAEMLFETTNLAPVICGAKSEVDLCRHLQELIKADTINLTGKISMIEFIALVSEAELLIGNDSGPAHVAAGVKTPVVAIMGTANIEMYKPWGDDVRICYREVTCGPCYAGECYMPKNICVQPVTVDEVVSSSLELLKTKVSG